jgi:hypothetical protein
MTQNFTPAERLALALDFLKRTNSTDADFARVAYQYQVDLETLEALYDRQALQWAAARGYDF